MKKYLQVFLPLLWLNLTVKLIYCQNPESLFLNSANKSYVFMEFNTLPDAATMKDYQEQGLHIYDYIGGTTYLVCVGPSFNGRSIPYKSLMRIKEDNRMSTEILNGSLCNVEEGNSAKISIQYFPEQDIDELQKVCVAEGIKIEKIAKEHRAMFVICPISKIAFLKNVHWIQYMGCTPERGLPEDREGRSLHRVNLVGRSSSNSINLDGAGVNVLVRDDGPVGPHIDFKNRLNNQTFGTNGSHGDGVAGIIAGAGNVDPLVEGMAPASNLYVINYQDDFLDNTINLHQSSNVVITNSSYSNGCNLGYTLITQIVDRQANENPSLLHCFSAGNSNNLDCGYGAGNQWGNITGGHKIGKNVITTANLMINGIVDNSSSRGPTKDGRMKPDVSARGTNENSTDLDNSYQVFGGTSAASPGVAGTAALLYQAYRNMNAQKDPEAALIKATLMNTATDLGTPGPDYVYGCGVIDAFRAYNLLKENRYQKLKIAHGEKLELEVNVPANIGSAKWMIYWEEKEASLQARKVLINDLDLEVFNPSGTKILPMVLNPTPDPTTLANGAAPGVDTLNNFEQVIVLFPEPGKYKIRVNGKFLPDQSVDFYLLNDFVEDKLLLTSPIGGEKFNSLESTNIYFNSFHSDTIKIDLSTDGGITWKTIKSVSGDAKLTNWTIGSSINSDSCVLRLSQNNVTTQSGLFTITNAITGLKIEKYCPNEITLTWAQSSKDSFLVYKLMGNTMEAFQHTDTNNITIPINGRDDSNWFAVSGYREGVLGRRSKAIGIPDTLVKCQLTNDLSIRPRNEWQNERRFVSCGSASLVYPEIIVYNRNINEVNNFEIRYFQGNTIISELIQKKLKYKDSVVVKLKAGIPLDFDGVKKIPVWVALSTDEFALNDTTQLQIQSNLVNSNTGDYPMIEDFESNQIPNDWIVSSGIPVSLWQIQSQKDKNLNSSKVVGFTNSNYSYANLPLGLYSKTIDLTNAIQPTFYMDYAYFKSNSFVGYYDTLFIEIQEICSPEKSYVLFSGAETALYTAAPNAEISRVPDSTGHWRTFAIDLSAFKGKKIIAKLTVIRGVYSNLYIDNIKVIEKESSTPTMSINWEPKEICISNLVKFNGSIDPEGPGLVWNFGANSTPRAGNGNGIFGVRYTAPGNKLITVSAKVNNLYVISTRELIAYQNPLAAFDYFFGNNRLVEFKNFSTNIKEVLWEFGDGTSSTEINPTHQFTSDSLYVVSLTIKNVCGSNKISLNVDLRAVAVEDPKRDALRIYPNPSNGEINIESDFEFDTLDIFSIGGNKILNCQGKTMDCRKLHLQGLTKGMYILKVTNINQTLETRFLLY